MRLSIYILLTGLMTATAHAAVVKSTEEGFIVHHSVTVAMDKSSVFEAMTTKVGQWWSSDHTFSGDAGNMLIDQQCFCERWEGNLVRHLSTTAWLKNTRVIMEGGLGPLKELGLTGTMIWKLESSDDAATTISWKYHVYGYGETNLKEFATVVDGVLGEQVQRLAGHLE